MDWDDLRYVLELSRSRKLSGAATALGVTHTTVGRRLQAIEEVLGVRLFDRTPDGFMPTPSGQDFAAVAEKMEDEILSLEGRVLGRDVRLAGSLRVATMDMLFYRFHETFTSFAARYPSVALTVSASDVEVSLMRRQADVALRLTGSPPEHLVGRKLCAVDFAVYAAADLVERVGSSDLADYPWLSWDERLEPRWLDDWLAHNAPGAEIAMRVDFSSVLLHEAVAAGIGVHFLATFIGDADVRLRRLGPVAEAFRLDVWVLTLPDLRHTPRIRAFMDHVAEHVTDTAERVSA